MTGVEEEYTWLAKLPNDARQAFTEWLKKRDFRFQFIEWLDDGRSGAYVAHVIRTLRAKGQRQVIVKFTPPEDAATETLAVERATREPDPAFVKRHLVEIEPPVDLPNGWLLVFQQYAGNNGRQYVSFAERMQTPTFERECAEIVRSVIADWNPDERTQDPAPVVGAVDYLAEQVGAHEGLAKWTEETGLGGTAIPRLRFTGDDTELPNPLAMLSADSVVADVPVNQLRGHAHGDLHIRNILVPTRPAVKASDYLLIDLAHYDKDSPLARDPMHLLLSIAREWLRDLTPRAALRRELAKMLPHPETVPAVPSIKGYRALALEVHSAAAKVARPRTHAWDGQVLLSLCAQALIFAGRRVGTDDKWWFLEVAARSLAAFLEFTDRRLPAGETLEVPRHSPPPPPQQQSPAPAVAASRKLRVVPPPNEEPDERTAGPDREDPRRGLTQAAMELHDGIATLNSSMSQSRLAVSLPDLRAAGARIGGLIDDVRSDVEHGGLGYQGAVRLLTLLNMISFEQAEALRILAELDSRSGPPGALQELQQVSTRLVQLSRKISEPPEPGA